MSRMPERLPDLVVNSIGAELLVYDPAGARCHCLDAAAAAVFSVCDGKTPIGHAAAELYPDLSPRAAREALTRGLESLKQAGLLHRPQLVSRRTVLAGSLPLVTTVMVPLPAAASSCNACTAAFSGSLGCVNCPGNPLPAGPCQSCFGGCTCAQGQCMVIRQATGGSCAADNQSGRACLNMGVAQPANVNANCNTARSNASNAAVTLCDGTTFSGANQYYCCTGCT